MGDPHAAGQLVNGGERDAGQVRAVRMNEE